MTEVRPVDLINSVHLTPFCFDTMFTKSTRASTYIRRTILDVETYIPSYVERNKVKNV